MPRPGSSVFGGLGLQHLDFYDKGLILPIFSNIKAILFDFDGTLVEPTIDFATMRQAVLDVVGRYVDPAPYAGMYALEMIARVEDGLRHQVAAAECFATQAQQAIWDVELEAATRANPYPGVSEFLAELGRRGLGVGIVTRNCRVAVEQILARAPLRYDVLLTRDDVPHVKPDPRHLQVALDRLGVPAAQAVMCGDHPMDVMAGQRLGARTVGVLQPGIDASYFAQVGPDLIVPHVADILAHLGQADGSGRT
jgi:phosphoglycolate phosphatase